MPVIEGKTATAWIDAYVAKKDANLVPVAQRLRKLVKKTVVGVEESVNAWKMPTFLSNGPMCYFTVGKNHVTFGFLRGTALADPKGLLEGTGKNLRHVKLRSVEDVERPELKKLIESSVKLNKREPSEGMRIKKKG